MLAGPTQEQVLLLSGAGTNTHSINLVRASAQYLRIASANQTNLNPSADFTLSGWFKPTSQPTSGLHRCLITHWKYNPNLRYFFILYRVGADTKILLQISSSGTSSESYWDVTLNPTLNTWTHLAVAFDASEPTATQPEFYVDGSSVGNGVIGADGDVHSIYTGGNGDFQIGYFNQSGNHYFDGPVDNCRLWKSRRSDAQILADYNVQLGDVGQGGDWNFNNVLTDTTANANTLTAVNSPTFITNVPFS